MCEVGSLGSLTTIQYPRKGLKLVVSVLPGHFFSFVFFAAREREMKKWDMEGEEARWDRVKKNTRLKQEGGSRREGGVC